MARSKSISFKGDAAGAFLRASMGKETTLVHELESVAIATHIAVKDGDMVSAVRLLETVKATREAPKPLDLPGGWRQVGESFEGPNVGEAITMPREGIVRVWEGETIVEVDVHALAAIVSRMGYRVEER